MIARRNFFYCFLCGMVFSLSVRAEVDGSAEVRAFWESWRDARVAWDVEAVREAATADFVMTRPTGQQLDRDGYAALWDPTVRSLSSIRMTALDVRMHGDAAVACVRLEVEGISVATGAPLGFPPLQVTSLLVRENGEWRAAALHATALPLAP